MGSPVSRDHPRWSAPGTPSAATGTANQPAQGYALAMSFAATYPNVMAGPIVEPAPA
jgi:hypothetical protein